MKKSITACAILLVTFSLNSSVLAGTVTLDVQPWDVPDENVPAVNINDAPVGFGPESWQNTQTGGKVNWHARYVGDGDSLSTLFPGEAETMTVNDIASIKYWSKRPDGTPAGQDWAVFIYTRPMTGGDSSWYGHRFVNNYNEHTNLGDWTQYSTDTGMTFRRNSGTTSGLMSFADLKTGYGDELVEMISIQTMSNYTSFNGFADGLEITLGSGSVGQANLVPEPATMSLLALGGLAVLKRRRRRGV